MLNLSGSLLPTSAAYVYPSSLRLIVQSGIIHQIECLTDMRLNRTIQQKLQNVVCGQVATDILERVRRQSRAPNIE
jgi:hypothetical protein